MAPEGQPKVCRESGLPGSTLDIFKPTGHIDFQHAFESENTFRAKSPTLKALLPLSVSVPDLAFQSLPTRKHLMLVNGYPGRHHRVVSLTAITAPSRALGPDVLINLKVRETKKLKEKLSTTQSCSEECYSQALVHSFGAQSLESSSPKPRATQYKLEDFCRV